jgi:hypothetical protein
MTISKVSERGADSCSPLARGLARRPRRGLSRVAWLPAVLAVASLIFAGCGSSEETSDAGADAGADSDSATSPCQPLGPGMPCREDIETLNSQCYMLDNFSRGTTLNWQEDPRSAFVCRCEFQGVCGRYGEGWACDDGFPRNVTGNMDGWQDAVDGGCDFSPCDSATCFEGALVYHRDNVPDQNIVPPDGECYLRAFPPGDPRNEYLCSCGTAGDFCETGSGAGQPRTVYQCTSTRIGTYWKQATGLSVERELYPPRIPQCDFDICWSCDYRNHPLGN